MKIKEQEISDIDYKLTSRISAIDHEIVQRKETNSQLNEELAIIDKKELTIKERVPRFAAIDEDYDEDNK